MRFYRFPLSARVLFPSAICRIKGVEEGFFLTFDDGPSSFATSSILGILEKFGAPATFFMRGDSAEKYPSIFRDIVESGHQTGNHTYNHPDGWLTGTKSYVNNIEKASRIIRSNLFRPPYGRITPLQYLALRKRYTIILWDVMGYDFNQSEKDDQLIGKISEKIRPGSILALHDSETSRAPEILEPILERVISSGLRPLPLQEYL